MKPPPPQAEARSKWEFLVSRNRIGLPARAICLPGTRLGGTPAAGVLALLRDRRAEPEVARMRVKPSSPYSPCETADANSRNSGGAVRLFPPRKIRRDGNPPF